jgi:hypothetical protein
MSLFKEGTEFVYPSWMIFLSRSVMGHRRSARGCKIGFTVRLGNDTRKDASLLDFMRLMSQCLQWHSGNSNNQRMNLYWFSPTKLKSTSNIHFLPEGENIKL